MLTRMQDLSEKSPPAPELSAADRIVAAIRAVPRGQVAGYGVIARRAGLPGRARMVARLLGVHSGTGLPWHRILRSDGRIAFSPDSAGFLEQARLLRGEGVEVRNGRVRMPRDSDGLDATIWLQD